MATKDNWDKIDVITKIFSSIIIAVVGILVTIIFNNKEIQNQDLRLVNDYAIMIEQESPIKKMIGFNTIFMKKGIKKGIELINDCINENNIEELCKILQDYKGGLKIITEIVKNIYMNETYQISQITYKTKDGKRDANGIFTNDGKIRTIIPIFDSHLNSVTIYDPYENNEKIIPESIIALDRAKNEIEYNKRQYTGIFKIYDGIIPISTFMFCLFINKNHEIEIKICQVLSSEKDIINVHVLDDDKSIPTGSVLLSNNREYIGLKIYSNTSGEVATFARL